MRPAVVLAVGLAACPTRDGFDWRYAIRYCDDLRRCDSRAANDLWLYGEACQERVFHEQRGVSACLAAHCTMDRSAARRCLGRLDGAACDAFTSGRTLDPCGEVWVGCDPVGEACRGDP